jgi:RNA polymerase-binding transcription factor DksA
MSLCYHDSMNNVQHFKEKLEKELSNIESELASVGRVNPSNPSDWEATPPIMDIQRADPNEVADQIEEYEENTGILRELEIRLGEIKSALKKIEDGTYGICEVDGSPIEHGRLEANPAAKTCMKHMV